MIIIEKLRTRLKPKLRPLPEFSVGLIDFYHSDLHDRRYPHLWHSKPHLLRNRAERYLAANGIMLAKHRGVHGVSPFEADCFVEEMKSRYTDCKVIFEVDIVDFLELASHQIQYISKNHFLLFSDLVEGDMWTQDGFGILSDEQLGKAGVRGDRAWLLSCNVRAAEQLEKSLSGINLLPWCNSFETITITNEHTAHFLDNAEDHLKQIDHLYDQTPDMDFLSINGKPRRHRVALLDALWRAGLLDRTAWSLGYFPEQVQRQPTEHISRGHIRGSQRIRELEKYDEFLDAHTLPQFLGGKIVEFDMITAAPLELMDKARWHLVTEPIVLGPTEPGGNPQSNTLITEKFYKSVIMGQPAIPVGWQGSHPHHRQAGYQLPDLDFSHLDEYLWEDRLSGTFSMLTGLDDNQWQSFRNSAISNMERMVDSEALVRSVCEPLLQIREHPSFDAF